MPARILAGIDDAKHTHGKELLYRIVAMLVKVAARENSRL
jgi:hypothetical protein